MHFRLALIVCAATLLAPLVANPLIAADKTRDDAALDFFEKKVRPLLAENCYNCHSANTNSRGGLRVDDRVGLTEGGNRGPAVVPGDPEKSLMIQAVRQTGKLKMPPEKKLTDEQVEILVQWIRAGVAWPKIELPTADASLKRDYESLRKEHWAWQPLKAAAPPEVKDTAWPLSDLDRFILAKLEQFNLPPVGQAEPLALLRRLKFDLTGLPPTLEELEAFSADHSPRAFEDLVDRLLASPAFGERWGRHWLDVARYGESTGSARNVAYPHAWRYRDYVIEAFNRDKPYDQFVREQIAGDLLPSDTPEQRNEQLIATGFLALGVKDVNQRFKIRYVMDNIDEQIDALSKAFLGLTASCARCHDHKFDPIPTADYYALAGIFKSSDLCAALRNQMGGGGMAFYDTKLLLVLGPKAEDREALARIEDQKKELATCREELEALTSGDSKKDDEKKPDGADDKQPSKNAKAEATEDAKVTELRNRIKRLQREMEGDDDPALRNHVAFGMRDSKTIADTEIRIRGEAEKLGPTAPRGFLSLISLSQPPQIGAEESGRRQLAEWLTSDGNPLAPRVIVNRVWQHLFGEGLVRTVDNFGSMGDSPSHPELLDTLAIRFKQEGWSIKKLVRQIVLSRTYQLSAAASDQNMKVDPENVFLWRHSPRRLEAEEIRDAMLAASGQLKLTPPEGSAAQAMKMMELPNNGGEAQRLAGAAEASLHRSVYLPLLRNITPQSLAVFDFAEQGMVTGRRDVTTVAPQALYLLNDPLVRKQGQELAQRVLQDKQLTTTNARIERLYKLTLGRTPTTLEIARGKDYVTDYIAESKSPGNAAASSESPAAAVDNNSSDEKPPGKQPAKPVKRKAAQPKAQAKVDPRIAAWATFCQALLGSAEFRYLK